VTEGPLQLAAVGPAGSPPVSGRIGLVFGSEVVEAELTVGSTYTGFDELWQGFEAGIGPAGSYCLTLPTDHRGALHDALHERLGSPAGPFTLAAVGAMGPGIDPWRGGGGSRLVAPVAGTCSRRTPDASGPPPGVLVLVFVLGPADRRW